ncbi:MAG: hypothetical protein JKY94_17835 [Rhodobacteraceae bacterium]|nr:hypothetical protein [Paracoccaceae bacterium]
MILPLPLLPALALFSETLAAFDQIRTEVKGQAVRTDGPDYTLTGSFQPAGANTVRLMPEGTNASGLRVLKTPQTLHFLESGEVSTDNTQTFIRYRGNVWRIVQELDWQAYGGFNGYICERYLRQGV